MQTIDINPHQRLTGTWLPITVGEWLAAGEMIARQLPPEQHLRFLVQLMTSLQRAGVDMSEHRDCLIDALVWQKEGERAR